MNILKVLKHPHSPSAMSLPAPPSLEASNAPATAYGCCKGVGEEFNSIHKNINILSTKIHTKYV